MLNTFPTILTRVWPGLGVGKGTGEIPVSLLASVDAAAKKSTGEVHFKPGPAQAVPSNKRSLSVAASGPLATSLQWSSCALN